MRNSLTINFGRVFVLAVLLASGREAWARPPRASERCGVLERIDQQTHSLVVRSPRGGKPLEAVWKKNTRFVRNGKFASGSLPDEGAHVCVFYRSPFFGDPFVTKVVWRDG